MRALRNALVGLGIALAFLLAGTTPAGAAPAPGTLDPTFGDGGTAVLRVPAARALHEPVLLVQPDDKLVIVGWANAASVSEIAFVRLLPDGTIDPGFGTDGVTVVAMPDFVSGGVAAALAPDGRIVAFTRKANGSMGFLLVRLTPDGEPDPTFGGTGIVDIGNGSENLYPYAVAVGPDGAIAASLSGSLANSPKLVRVTEDGQLDPDFGLDGVVDSGLASVRAVSVLPDKKILATGTQGSGFAAQTTVVRYKDDGSLDTGFGVNGKAAMPTGTGGASAHLILPDGKVLAGGTLLDGSKTSLGRFSPDGAPDPSFGTEGVAELKPQWSSPKLALERDGRVVASVWHASTTKAAVVRLLPDGSPDPEFGEGGWVDDFGIPMTGFDLPIVTQSGRRIVVANTSTYNDADLGRNAAEIRLAALRSNWPDADGDGVPDHRDGCPTVPASTPNGCPTPTPTGQPAGAPQQGGGVQPAPPKPPAARIVGAVPTRLRQLARGSLPVTVACDQRCRISAKLQISRSTARRLGIAAKANTLTIGSASRALPRPGSAKLTVKLTRTAKQRLRRATRAGRRLRLPARLVVTVTWPDGGKRTLARTVTFR